MGGPREAAGEGPALSESLCAFPHIPACPQREVPLIPFAQCFLDLGLCLALCTVAGYPLPWSPPCPAGSCWSGRPRTTPGWMPGPEPQSWGGREERSWGEGSFLCWTLEKGSGEPLSPSCFRRGQKGCRGRKGSGERPRSPLPPQASALIFSISLLPSPVLRQVHQAETPTPSVPCCSSPALRRALPAGSCSPKLSWAVGGAGWTRMAEGRVRVGGERLCVRSRTCWKSVPGPSPLLPPPSSRQEHPEPSLSLCGQEDVGLIVG